jgi:hypothetical protein
VERPDPCSIERKTDLRKKQASNIPSEGSERSLQKPAVLEVSKKSLAMLLPRLWSFRVFVQILGFYQRRQSEPPA